MARWRTQVWPAPKHEERPGGLLGFCVSAVVVGVLTGLMSATFRIALDGAGELRRTLIAWAHGAVGGLLLVMALCAAATAAAAALVHRIEPHAEGSGIPRVEAVVAGRTAPGSPLIFIVKYVGGLLAIGSGLALGREGPSVQMGGNIGIIVGRLTRRNLYDLRILIAAGAAAGLATAFNAPIAGGVFVLEELVRRFDPRTTTATLLASAAGFGSASLVLGGTTAIFRVAGPLDAAGFRDIPAVAVVGLVTGFLGVLYNRAVMAGQHWVDTSRLPRELRAAIIGASVGALGFYAPTLVGGGDGLTQEALLASGTLGVIAAVFALRFVLGVVSYAAATPGGLFAPMLVLGSQLGLMVGLVGQAIAPDWTPQPAALALIGIAAFFTATVRAPITGIVLAVELTGVTSQLPAMLGACALAMVVATVCKSEPIYDALAARAARAAAANRQETASGTAG